MKNLAPTVVLMTAAGAALGNTAYEDAVVLESIPVYRTVEFSMPRQECWQEEIARHSRRDGYDSRTPDLLGAVIGGAVGSAVGHNKSNKRVGAVVGALLGGSVARDLSHRGRRESSVRYDTVEHCRTVHDRRQDQKLVGYDVLYSYNGREYSVRLPRDPGPTLRLRVEVEPVF
jgi:uncharacterized protein YcfJ